MAILRRVGTVDGDLRVKVTVFSKEDRAGVITYVVAKEYNHPIGEYGVSQQYDVLYHLPDDKYFVELVGHPLSEFDVLAEEDFRREMKGRIMA